MTNGPSCIMLDFIGTTLTFNIFGALCGIGTIFLFFWILETNGKNLKEVGILCWGLKE